jgi:hypothetical protein
MKRGNFFALIIIIAVVSVTIVSALILNNHTTTSKVPQKETVNLNNEDAELDKIENEMAKDVPLVDESLEGNTQTITSTEPNNKLEVDADLNSLDNELNNVNLPNIDEGL